MYQPQVKQILKAVEDSGVIYSHSSETHGKLTLHIPSNQQEIEQLVYEREELRVAQENAEFFGLSAYRDPYDGEIEYVEGDYSFDMDDWADLDSIVSCGGYYEI